jgi:copper chaperone CopZ
MKLLPMLFLLSSAHAEFLRIEVSMKDMNCASCSESLGKAFEKMRGVQHVEVAIDKGTVALELADKNRVTLEQVWDAVKRIGFTPGATTVAVRGAVKGSALIISVIDKTIQLEGRAVEGENVELNGSITPPPDPRTPIKLHVSN